MLALLALAPSRRKNFAALEIGKTFKQVRGTWWVTISANKTSLGNGRRSGQSQLG